jgi:hypothetical protein
LLPQAHRAPEKPTPDCTPYDSCFCIPLRITQPC